MEPASAGDRREDSGAAVGSPSLALLRGKERAIERVVEITGRRPSTASRVKVDLLARWLLRGVSTEPGRKVPLRVRSHAFLDDVLEVFGGEGAVGELIPSEPAPLLVSTVRMGFGHHRIAHAVGSWAEAMGVRPVLHDLLGVEAPEADVVRGADRFYSRLSRLAVDLGGPFERLWGWLMTRGDADSLHLSMRLAWALRALMTELPADVPMVTTFPLNGQMAVALGFRRVVNTVIDNHPQHFTLVPGALNLVQSPSYHSRLLQMGVPADQVAFAGHWVPQPIVKHAAADAASRIARADARLPRRLLVPIGGAGAQSSFVAALLRRFRPWLEQGRARVFLNAGDHVHAHERFVQLIEMLGLPHTTLCTASEVRSFCHANALAEVAEPADACPIVLASFRSHFEAFSATDQLVRAADVLVTKPSELAFYPIPKLHIRRVGNHEAASAHRSAELGDGTHECRSIAEAHSLGSLLIDSDDLFQRMNEDIVRSHRAGVYSGAEVAVQRALR